METIKRPITKPCLFICILTVWFFAVSAVSHAAVTVQLSDSAGSDSFQVLNSGSSSVFHSLSDGKVGIGTTTPSAMLHIEGSSTVSAITLRIVGTTTVVGTLTASNVDVSSGTVTAAGFIGDGSQLTNVPAGSVGSQVIVTSNFNPSIDFVTTGTISAGSASQFTVNSSGSMTAAAIDMTGFDVDSAGSMTATEITTTGTITVSGNLKVGGILKFDNPILTIVIPDNGTATDTTMDIQNASIVKVTHAGNSFISGIQGGITGRILLLLNISAGNVKLIDASTTSAVGNRIDGSGFHATVGWGVMLIYDGSNWIPLKD